jgi:arginase family enzyme
MSTIDFYFTPLSAAVLEENCLQDPFTLAQNVEIYLEGSTFPEAENAEIAIIGVQEGRGNERNAETEMAPDAIRKQLYSLCSIAGMRKVVDLGNIRAGETDADTFFAVKNAVERLLRINVLPIIIGGSNHVAFAQYAAYEFSKKMLDVVSIDSKLDMREPMLETDPTNDENFLYRIIMHQQCFLFNLVNLGYQTHLNPHMHLEMIERLFFDAVRVGKLREDIKIAEPHLRGADVVFFDVSAIRASEFGANAHAPANGLSNDEACQLARYAGMSDRLTSFGLYNYNPLLDQQKHSAKAAADILWYFMEGYFGRVNDIPTANSANFARYLVDIDQEGNHSLVFHKSRKTDRWWIEVPAGRGNETFENIKMVPCTYNDYLVASTQGELPDIWWRFHQKYFV